MLEGMDQVTLGLAGASDEEGPAEWSTDGDLEPGQSFVAVAIDAAGAAGSHPFTYRVPERLEPLRPGEAVLVEFGRRQALGIVLDRAAAPEGIKAKPILDRVRADGPLLAPSSIEFARLIAATYLAPPAMVLRAMLPPGMLERLELVAEERPRPRDEADTEATPDDPPDAEILEQLRDGPRAVRRLRSPEGRAGLLRRLRTLREAGRVELDWTLLDSGSGPRYVRIVRVKAPTGGAGSIRLGPRQTAALAALAEAGGGGIPAPDLSGRYGASVVGSLLRRDLVTIETVESPRRPLEGRRPGFRGARPAMAMLSDEQALAVAAIQADIEAGNSTPTLLDGVTGGGKTAIYAAVIGAAMEAGRRALVLVPEIALALPLVDRLRADLQIEIGLVHSGLSDGERSDEWRRIRAGAVDVVVGTRVAILAPVSELGVIIVDEEHDPAYKSDRTPRLQARDAAV
ncbi:MAG: DEAD/DEAH box helicase, partial [Chloroflexota bacterium]